MNSLFFLLFVKFISVKSLSVCDDLDIYFLVDKDSLIHNYDGVAGFVEAIIEDGSSEDAAFSLHIYGNELSDYQLASQLNLLDTHDTFRANKSTTILQRLQQIYDDISTITSTSALHDISLADAFADATQQAQPQRKYIKRKRFHKAGFKTHGFGAADDEDRFFIFDHFNKLTDITNTNTGNDAEICQLFEYIGDHSDQSIHFIMGQQYKNMQNTFDTICGNKYTPLFHDDLFFYLNKTINIAIDNYDNEFDDHLENLERIFHLSCPAQIHLDDAGGSLHLTAHNQWIEADTIRKCILQYGYDGDQDKLDPDHSVIYVDDHLFDHNTFKLGDHLIADAATWEEIQPLGCSSPIYKIVNIKHVKTSKSRSRSSGSYKILKLYVELPESMQDYILMADFNIDSPGFATSSKNYDIYTSQSSQADYKEYYMEEAEAEAENNDHEEGYRGYENKRRMSDIYDKYIYEMDSDGKDSAPKPVERQKTHVGFTVEPRKEAKPVRKSLAERAIHKAHKRTRSAGHVLKSGGKALVKSLGKSLGKRVSKLANWVKNKRMKPQKVTPEFQATFNEKEYKDEVDKGTGFDEAAEHKNLFTKEMKQEIEEKEYTITAEQAFGPVKIVASGTIKAKAKVQLDLKLDFVGKFHWLHLFKKSDSGTATLELKLIGTVEAIANFHFEAEVTVKVIGQFPEISQGFWIIAPPAPPVYFRPYVTASISLEIPKLKFVFDLHAHYKEVITWQYKYYAKRQAAADVYTKDTSKPETDDGFTITRGTPDKDFDVTLALTDGENNNACKVALAVVLAVEPKAGLAVYWALGVEASFILKAPIAFTVEIPRTEPKCKNEKIGVCKDTTGTGPDALTALPSWKLTLEFKIEAYVKMPNFLKVIKQAYVLRKIAKGIERDLVGLKDDGSTYFKRLISYLTKLKIGLKQMKEGHARLGLGNILLAMQEIRKWVKEGENAYTKNKAKVDKRMGQIEEFYNAMTEIIGDPLGITRASAAHTFGPWDLIGERPYPDKCVTIPATSVIAKAIKKGCCATLTFPAHQDFDDWYYGGSDAYGAYNAYGDAEVVGPVAPVARVVHVQPSNNPFLALMLLDIFTIFIIMICMAGCLCVLCGAFVFYHYNKGLTKQEYNQLNVHVQEDQI